MPTILAYLPCVPRKAENMAKTNPFQFIQQTRAEVSKVVWPSRREALLTTGLVLVLAALTALFFSLVDWGIRSGMGGIFNVFGG